MISIHILTFNALQENTYVLYDETKECVIIDPGCYSNTEKQELREFIQDQGLTPVRLLNTHCHVDHVLGNHFVQETFQLKVETSRVEEAQLRSVKLYAPMYGFLAFEESEVGAYLEEGDTVEFGKSRLEVISVPGHSPGHLAFINKAENICISGDVLFRGSVGRYDLPGGDLRQLENSIRTKLYTLAEEMRVFPGHGPMTHVGFEKKFNPVVRG